MVLKLDRNNFEDEVSKSSTPVLVDFYADWCMPCRMLAPIVDQISRSDLGIKVGKINVDDQIDIAMAFNAGSIPLLVLFKNGRQVARMLGYHEKDEIVQMIKDNI